MLKKLRDRIFGVEKMVYLSTQKMEEISSWKMRELKAFEILKPYFNKGFLFETGFTISFQTFQHIANDIVLFKPKTILKI